VLEGKGKKGVIKGWRVRPQKKAGKRESLFE
jgi:hypothetical protein